MADAGSGSLVARGYVQLRADHSRLPGDLANARSIFRDHLVSMSNIAGGILAAAGIRGIMGLGRSIGAVWLQASSQMESFTTSLGVLLRSESEAKSLMRDIEQMAAVTPFTTQSLAEAVIQLKVFGFETKKLLPMLRVIGDAASAAPQGMADGLQRISYALGQIHTAGKVSRREMRQLTMAGVDAWGFLAAKLGKTTAQVSDMVRAGQVSASVAIEAILSGMQGRFGGMMQKMSRTWIGLWSTLTDNIRIFARQAGAPLFAIAKEGLVVITEWFNTEQAQLWVGRISALISGTVTLVKTVFASAWMPVIVRLAKAFSMATGLAGALGAASTAASVFRGTLAAILSPVGLIVSGATAFLYILQDALDGPHGKQLQSTLDEIWTYTQQIGSNLQRGFGQFTAWLKRTWTDLFGTDLKTGVHSLMQDFMDFVKAASYQITIFTADFNLTWEYLKAGAQLAWLGIQSYATDAYAVLRAQTLGFVAAAVEAFNILDEHLGITLAVNKIVEWATSAANSVLNISATIMQLVMDFGSLAIGVVAMLELRNAIMFVITAMTGLTSAMNAATFAAMLNPIGLLVVGLGVLGAAFVGSKIEAMSFGEYVAMMLEKICHGALEAGDAIIRLKKSLETEADFAEHSEKIDEAMQGPVTDEKIAALKREGETADKQAKDQEKEVGRRRQALVDKARELGMNPTQYVDEIKAGKYKDDDEGNAYRQAVTDQKRIQERQRRIKRYIGEREAEKGAANAAGEPTDPMSVWGKRIRDAYGKGVEGAGGMPVESEEDNRRKKELQDRMDAIKEDMKGKQKENVDADDKDKKSRDRWAEDRRRGQPLPANVEGGGAGGRAGADLVADKGGVGKGSRDAFMGVAEFAKSLQAGLIKDPNEKAAADTADHTKTAADHLGTLVKDGVKVKNPLPGKTVA
jgi:tape measure domain-containing protein